MSTAANNTLRSLQARLDRQALPQLRETAAAQAAEIDRLTAELEAATRELYWAEGAARMWQEACLQAEENLPADKCMVLTQSGSLLVAATEGARPS